MITKINLLLNIDFYKTSHFLQYPPDTDYISSYIEARSDKYHDIVFFGLQIFLKQYLIEPICLGDIEDAELFLDSHNLPFNRTAWQYILDHHQGYLPIKIEAVPEGSILKKQNVCLQITNTDPKCFWLPSYLETALLRAIWYPSTVASLSYYLKKLFNNAIDSTGDLGNLDRKLHDFGSRGVSSTESAIIGGMAHLLNFNSSANSIATYSIKKFYNEQIIAATIPSAEHSTIITWGREHEIKAYENILTHFSGDNKMVSIVSDSYDLYYTLNSIWGDKLKDKVINNQGVIFIRPDSGDLVKTTIDTISILMNRFGYFTNKKGYKILPDYLRVIQADGINLDNLKIIIHQLELNHISIDNLFFGMGGELLQKVGRSDLEFVMKASAIKRANQEWFGICKSPATDKQKTSKSGRLALIFDPINGYQTINKTALQKQKNELILVYENGKIIKEYNFTQIRTNIQNSF